MKKKENLLLSPLSRRGRSIINRLRQLIRRRRTREKGRGETKTKWERDGKAGNSDEFCSGSGSGLWSPVNNELQSLASVAALLLRAPGEGQLSCGGWRRAQAKVNYDKPSESSGSNCVS